MGNRLVQFIGWVSLLFFFAAPSSDGAGYLTCEICGESPPTRFFYVTDRVRNRQVTACEKCSLLTRRCTTCALPVAKDFVDLGDSRFLCAEDAKEAVLDEEQAKLIYNDAKRDLFAVLSGLGALPDRNVTVQLVDQRELSRIFSVTPGVHQDTSLQGVTRSRRYSQDTFQHQIFLCRGLSRSRIAAVSAHEYMHAWICENVPTDRKLDRDIEEGFCELAAYQLMRQRGEAYEQRMIMENAYTRGKIQVLVKISEDYQFYRVAEWMKKGKDDTLAHERPDRVVALQSESSFPVFGYLEVVHARAPEVLTLKGLSGSTNKRYALVNDATLQIGEEVKVRVGSSNVLVRCLEIRDRSVLVRINGAGDSVELTLDK